MIDVMTVKRLATQFGLSDILECEYSNIGRADNLNKFANAVAAHQRDIDASICFAESEKAFKLKGTNDWSPYIEGMSAGADGRCTATPKEMPRAITKAENGKHN